MPEEAATDVTRILSAIERGDAGAASELLPVVYAELRRLAAQRMAREGAAKTQMSTAARVRPGVLVFAVASIRPVDKSPKLHRRG